jgi:hypothetical protein
MLNKESMMKKWMGLIVIAITMATGAFAKDWKTLPEIREVIPFTELTVEKVKELIDGKYKDTAILCEEGTELPLKFLFKYGLFSVKHTPELTVKIERTCYIRRYLKKKVYMSYDLVHWENAEKFFKSEPNYNVGVSNDRSHILIETDMSK